MDAAWKDRWIKALRSGDFKQGQQYLRHKVRGTYCCLGVLRELIAPGCTYSNEAVANLEPDHAKGLNMLESLALAKFNDNDYDFEYIANYIEKNIKSEYSDQTEMDLGPEVG